MSPQEPHRSPLSPSKGEEAPREGQKEKSPPRVREAVVREGTPEHDAYRHNIRYVYLDTVMGWARFKHRGDLMKYRAWKKKVQKP